MKPVFLFGSGADSSVSDSLKSGSSFARALLMETHKKEVDSLLGEDYKDYKIIYPTSTKVFIQTVVTYRKEAQLVLDSNDIKMCVQYDKDAKTISFEKDIKPICQKWYGIIMEKGSNKEKNDEERDKEERIREFFLNNAVFFDSLDEKFNSLRNIELNGNAKRIITAYTTIFVLMMKSVYSFPPNYEWTYSNIFSKLKEPYNIEPNKDSYYQQLSDSNFDYEVVTTNYTSLAESITKKKGEAVYLHGKLTWFEDLRNLTVYDATNDRDKWHLQAADRRIPFILIPSGVKPLICRKQIEEFAKFIKILDESKLLVVVGYKFNSEDNHVNSLIAEWLRESENSLLYFNFNGSVDFSSIEWAKPFSRKDIEYSEDENCFLSDVSIHNIKVDGTNSAAAFQKYIKIIQENVDNI